MTFEQCLVETIAMLRRQQRVSYRALKRQFGIDDAFVADLRDEIVEVRGLALDQDGRMLVWKGETPAAGDLRQLTVMFCDLVGSTELSSQLDPEDLGDLLRRYQRESAAAVERYGGFVAQYLGDGMLIYFGYPQAHEDAPERAIRAGLAILEGMQTLNRTNLHGRRHLAVRIGIHTGPVMLSEVGSGERREQLALGETPNVAAKLQAGAAPDSVLVSAATRRLAEGVFVFAACAPLEIKGRSQPLPTFRVLAVQEAEPRSGVGAQAPLLGRGAETGVLAEHWARSCMGEGQVVMLEGGAGIGKSRLVAWLRERIASDSAASMIFRCSPYFSNTALHPFIARLQHLLDFQREDSAATKLGKLEGALRRYRFTDARTIPLLAALLSVPVPEGRSPPLEMTPLQRKRLTADLLCAWLLEEAQDRAALVVVEDLHWADPSSLELLELLLERIVKSRMMMLLVFRPDFSPPEHWQGRPHVGRIALGSLQAEEVQRLVLRMLDDKSLPPEVMRHIVSKTDGVPLFVEELLKAILESGMLVEGSGEYALASPLLETAIPTTLQDSLMARLDRLGSARELAQVAATLGREFSYELIRAVAPADERALDQALARLVEADLILRRGGTRDARYIFKHALIRDVAYQSQLKSRRVFFHERIARVMDERFPELRQTQPELLAHHFGEAGLADQAADCWQRAAERAIERSAYVEALHHLDTALALHRSLPATPQGVRRELMLLTSYGLALTPTKGYASPALSDTYARAHELSRQIGEVAEIFPLLNGMWSFYLVRANYEASRELGEKMLRLAESAESPVALIQANRAMGVTLLYTGELASGLAHMEKAVDLYDPNRHRAFAYRLNGLDLGVSVRSFAAWGAWLAGRPAHALRRNDEMHAMARSLGHPYNSAWALTFSTWVHQMRREIARTREQAEAAIALAAEHRFELFRAISMVLRGWALALGGADEGISELRRGMERYFATGAESSRGHWAALLAEAYLRAGRIDEGLRALEEAHVERSGERYYEAELHRMRGELQLARESDPDAQTVAERCFSKALAVARSQGARSLELRAALSLCRLRRRQGHKDARGPLAEAYSFFSEGFDTADLQEAAALLEDAGAGRGA